MEPSTFKHTVFEYLAGRATPLEKQAVEEWLKQPANTEQFHQWLLEWELRQPQYVPDTQKAFTALLNRLDQPDVQKDIDRPNPGKTPAIKRFPFLSWRVAATVTLLLCAGLWLLRRPLLYKTYQTDFGQTSAFTLEDDSYVVLNANSSLEVPRFGFSGPVREVRLAGEAEFLVRHTRDHRRFIVTTPNQFQVEVLGTRFSVFARSRGGRVALSEGKIRLDYSQGKQNRRLQMKPGELVTMNQQGKLIRQKTEKPELQTAWKEQRFVFDNTSVAEICALLEENFGQQVRIADPDIASRTISGNFKAQTAADLLEILREVLNLRITGDKNTLTLQNPDSTFNPL